MARNKLTARKSCSGYIPHRVPEYPLRSTDNEESQDSNEVEDTAVLNSNGGGPVAEPQQEQEREEGPEERVPEKEAGENGGDEDPEEPPPPAPEASPVPPRPVGWVVTSCVRDGGDDYFHYRLLDLLESFYGRYRVGVEYRTQLWEHPRHPSFWKAEVHVRRTSRILRAARELSVHHAITARDTQEEAIADAARQALYVYNHRLYHRIQNGNHRHFPRRASGSTKTYVAPVQSGGDPCLADTVEMMVHLNTQLDYANFEIDRLRRNQEVERAEAALVREHHGGPEEHEPIYRGRSPPRKRPCRGSNSARTRFGPN